jgi:RNA polymerase sigma-70 factor (ECF subfamily)
MNDETIIELYWMRSEMAIKNTEDKYGGKLHQLAMKILFNHEDAEESVNSTYLTAWNTIPPQKPVYLFAYLAKICRYVCYGKLDWKTAKKRQSEIVELTAEMESCIPAPVRDADIEGEKIGQILNTFLLELPEEKRLIFMRRYWYGDSIRDISGRYGIGESKVKVSLHRTRNALRNFLEKEGIKV